jgi:uncharacterized protein YkwD
MVTRYVVLVASVCAALLACIGTVGLDADATQAAEGRYVAKCGGGRIFLNSDEARIFYLQNRERRERDRKTLCLHPALERAARGHARDMMERDYISHYTKGSGASPGDRVRREGYDYHYVGENIGLGWGTLRSPDAMMDNWMHSDSHRKTLLSRRYVEVGIGAVTGTFEHPEYGTLHDATTYVVDFGKRW